MGRIRIHNLIPFGAMLLVAGSMVGKADAGYIAAGIGASDEARFFETSGSSAAADDSETHRVLLTLAEWEHHVAGPATGGMTSQSVTPSSSGAAPVALTQCELPAAAQLVSWLGAAGKVWLPPAFLSGIFRPPRFVG